VASAFDLIVRKRFTNADADMLDFIAYFEKTYICQGDLPGRFDVNLWNYYDYVRELSPSENSNINDKNNYLLQVARPDFWTFTDAVKADMRRTNVPIEICARKRNLVDRYSSKQNKFVKKGSETY
jgi:hypothetical protein